MRKVCVLDDHLSVLKATSRLLLSAGLEAETFSDPKAFLRYAESEKPSLIVMDMQMPVMNGIEVQKRLRSVSPTTRVIVFSSDDDPAIRSQAIDAGASAFFLKPVHDEELLAAIEAALGND
jgi:FixJ family two-component response regulator